jgi:hypothetical protein
MVTKFERFVCTNQFHISSPDKLLTHFSVSIDLICPEIGNIKAPNVVAAGCVAPDRHNLLIELFL